MSLTWHATEANASGATSAITTSTVYDKLYARLSFNDNDVRAVYVDWGDGENRLRGEKANYQWKTFDNPVSGAVIEHTYTATGADFTPIIQTVNSEGFVSRYHMDGTNPDSLQLQPFTNNSSITGMAVTDGQATGILRVENKQVLSGIDNSIFNVRGPQSLYVMIPPLTESSTLSNIGDIILDITVVADDSMIATGTTSTAVGGAGQSVQTITKTITAANVTGGTKLDPIDSSDGLKGLVSQVLKVKWVNPKYSGSSRADDYTVNDSYKNVKIFIVTTDNNSTAYYYPVTYVSAGAPIKKANDPSRYITLDFSQSRAKASNVSNLQYRYDVGKAFFNPVYKWNAVTGSTGGVYEFFGDNTKLSGSSSKNVSFAYNSTRRGGLNGQGTITTPSIAFADNSNDKWILTNQVYRTNQFLIDDFGRFTDQYHLVRNSMQPASASNGIDTEVSSLTDNKPYVFRITPSVTTGSTDQITKLDFNVDSGGVYTQDYTEAAFQNGSSNMVSLAGMNSASFKDIAGNDRTANEYLLLLFPKKTNKIFFNINNYAKDLISKNISGSSFSTPWKIAGVSYAAVDNPDSISQDVYWKNVPFEDTTSVSLEYRDTGNKKYVEQKNDLSQSGYISFDMPTDWDSISLENLCGGYFDDNTNIVNSAGNLSLTVSGGCTAASFNPDGTFGNYLKFTRTGGDSLTSLFDSAEDVGAFKYIAYVSGTTGGSVAYSVKRPLWVVGEDGGNGANAALTELYLLYGEDAGSVYTPSTLTTATNVILTIRRINVYDILNGASKVDKGSSAVLLRPVDYDKGTSYQAGTYVCSGGAGSGLSSEFGTPLKAAWEDTSLYALKISLSGTVGTHTFPEIWNILDATESHVQVVKEIDDSAYSLSALGVTSDLSITRTGQYLTAVTKKGRVFIQKTGVGISSISFSSIATGDENSTTAFVDGGPSSMYGRLHMIRKIQAEGVPVYWDEIQKDGTYVRFWGVIQNLTENHATGGPTAIRAFEFTMTVTEVALFDTDGKLMTDIFPLGGIEDESSYT